ncbi:MAG: DUF11 domain-containing protein, partial [Actinomycetia bacterium]|nr:DUF11 domain-containing protein [Actinomycetes bacterium]
SAITCNTTTLTPGDTTNCTATYTVTQTDLDNGTITSTGAVSGESPDGTIVTATDPHTATLDRTPSISVTKSQSGNDDADGSSDISTGDTLTYTFAVANTGNTTLTGVAVSDPLAGISAVTCPSTTLAPGDATMCTATYEVTQTDVDSGQIDNVATVSGASPDGSIVVDSGTETVNPVQTPSIDLVKSLSNNDDADGSGSISPGDTLTYTYDVTNDGTVTLSGVTVTDPLPSLSAITCPVTTLAPGVSMGCTATYLVTQSDIDAGEITSTGNATGSAPDGADVVATDPHAVSLDPIPGLELAKRVAANADEDGSGNTSRGDTLTYEFAVTNTGNVTLTDLDLDDPLPGLSVVTCPSTSITPGNIVTCSATYVVGQADVDRGTIDNTATASVEGPGGDPTDPTDDITDTSNTSAPLPRTPAIDLVKDLDNNADEDGSGDISVGDTLTYTYDVTNTGNVSLTTV